MNLLRLLATAVILTAFSSLLFAENSYLGFDRNQYPGDENLASLHRTFSFTGYWLNNPPGEKSNSWTGKRKLIDSMPRDSGSLCSSTDDSMPN